MVIKEIILMIFISKFHRYKICLRIKCKNEAAFEKLFNKGKICWTIYNQSFRKNGFLKILKILCLKY